MGDEGSQGKDVLKNQEKDLKFAGELARAISDSDSQMFRNLSAQEEEAANQSFLQGLQQLFIQNARSKGRGGGSLFAVPDRRDETMAKAFGQQRETATALARERARKTLQNASAAAGVGIAAAPATANSASAIGQTERNVLAAGAEGAGAVLGSLENIFGNNQSQQAPTTGSATGRSLPKVRIS